MVSAIVLYGPKGIGKSWVAQTLSEDVGVHHVDVDALVLDLLAAGVRPDPADGWLARVERSVVAALDTHELVSVEATGAQDSDWRLADDLQAKGMGVLRVWVSAPKQVALQRLAARTTRRVPVSAQEASWIYTRRPLGRRGGAGRSDRYRHVAGSRVGAGGAWAAAWTGVSRCHA